jgi:hypothetical protein
MEQIFTGYLDKGGNHINTGDVVRFYFDGFSAYSESNDDSTEMIDIVWQEPETGEFYFVSDIGRAAYIFRYNPYCEVIGTIKDKDLIKEFSPELLNKLFSIELTWNS